MLEPVHPHDVGWRRLFASLRNASYRWLWLGSMAAWVGLRMQDVALGWLVLELTDSPFYLGLADFARYVPLLFFPALAGILADRVDRRKMLLITVTSGAVTTATLASFAHLGHITIWHVLILIFLSGAGFSAYFTIRQALIATVVDRGDLLNAFSMDFAGASFVRVLGPSLAGFVISAVGVANCLYLEALGYVSALFLFARLRLRHSGMEAGSTNAWEDFKQQWRYVRQNKAVFDLMVLSAVLIPFGMSYRTLIPVFARDVLGTGARGLGVLIGASGVGAAAAALVLAAIRDARKRGLIVITGAALVGATLMLFATSRRFLLSLLLISVTEGVGTTYQTIYKVVIQDRIPDEFRGRITGMYLLVWGLLPLGSLLMGSAADWLGAPVAVGMGGGVCLVFALGWGFFRSELARLN